MIVPLNKAHLNRLACLHLEHLHTPFRGQAGKQMLIHYYAALMMVSDGAQGYVAETNGDVAGYVCGVWDSSAVRHALFKHRSGWLISSGVLQVLSHPGLLYTLWQRWKVDANTALLPHNGYELRPIVVDPAYRGTGIASQLVQRLLLDAAERGFDHVFLYTEADNATANAFYRKVGFKQASSHSNEQDVYIRYEISTN